MKLSLHYAHVFAALAIVLSQGCIRHDATTSLPKRVRLSELLPPANDVRSVAVNLTTRTGIVRFAVSQGNTNGYARFHHRATQVVLRGNSRITRQLQRTDSAAFPSLESGYIEFVTLRGDSETLYIVGRNLLVSQRREAMETKADLILLLQTIQEGS